MTRRFLHRTHRLRMRVSENRRSPGADVVDVAFAVGVPKIRPLSAGEKAGRASHRTECAYGGIDPCGNGALRAREKLFVASHDGCPECAMCSVGSGARSDSPVRRTQAVPRCFIVGGTARRTI